MTAFEETIEVPRTLDETFAYVADFTTAAEWDPGITSSRRLDSGPIRVGSEFDVVASFRDKETPFRYVVRELEPERRIVIHGDGEKATSDDTITFESTPGGTRIIYRAELKLKGFLRVAEPFLAGTFSRMGREALAGLREQLSTPAA